MEFSVEIVLDGAPKRQQYCRVWHILSRSSLSIGKLDASLRDRYLTIAVEHLKAGISVGDIRRFLFFCAQSEFLCDRDCLLLQEDVAVVGARAEAAMRVAEGVLHRLRWDHDENEVEKNIRSHPKRSRLEGADFGELKEELKAAEIFADMQDYKSMSEIFKHLLEMAREMHQLNQSSNKMQFIILQLEIIRRNVELWLGVERLDVVWGLVETSTAALITQAVQCLHSAQVSNLSHMGAQRATLEEVISKIEEFVLFFSIVRALCMFNNEDFSGFVRTFTPKGLRGAGWVPAAEDLLIKRSAAQVPMSIDARLCTFGSLPVIGHLRSFVGEFITSAPHLGVMVLFCALQELPRIEAMELITSADIMQLWDVVPGAQVFVEALQGARFVETPRMASALISTYLQMDLFAYKHCHFLICQFEKVVVKWYASCFAHLDLKKAASRLSMSHGTISLCLTKLIEERCLSARLDLVSHVLRRTEETDSAMDAFSPQFSMLLDCIYRSDRCSSEVEQSLRILSLHRHLGWQ